MKLTRSAKVALAAVASAASGNLEEFYDAKCAICMSDVYENRSDGGATIDAREMKCPGRHTFHTQCASGWFINEDHNVCPFCRHDFSSCFIEANLAHQVEYNAAFTGFTVHWKNPRHQRLGRVRHPRRQPDERRDHHAGGHAVRRGL